MFSVRLIPAHAGKTCAGSCWHPNRSAHPRSRGENGAVNSASEPLVGSSPLTRGKLRRDRDRRLHGGLIPAHAGKTSRYPSLPKRRTAHPRSRGENRWRALRSRAEAGSSPLTRGKRNLVYSRRHSLGLIPAHAGKTSLSSAMMTLLRAHPRSRGENALMSLGLWARSGSSPLTRGKLRAFWRRRSRLRLIPAHAGKTNTASRSPTRTRAHPRSRGENHENVGLDKTIGGSSPLTRGKLCGIVTLQLKARLIPAHAGKTLPVTVVPISPPAHPRSRGENSDVSWPRATTRGSSPLTRGKRPRRGLSPRRLRLIPAHAGKTSPPMPPHVARAAHPRSRGENLVALRSGMTLRGSSPLTRGKLQSTLDCCVRVGLIPAHAGKTSFPSPRSPHPAAHPRSRGENPIVLHCHRA